MGKKKELRKLRKMKYEDNFRNFGMNLKIMRIKAGFTQHELADHLDCSQATICRLEKFKDEFFPSISVFFNICKFFEVSVFDMLSPVSKKDFKKAEKREKELISEKISKAMMNNTHAKKKERKMYVTVGDDGKVHHVVGGGVLEDK